MCQIKTERRNDMIQQQEWLFQNFVHISGTKKTTGTIADTVANQSSLIAYFIKCKILGKNLVFR